MLMTGKVMGDDDAGILTDLQMRYWKHIKVDLEKCNPVPFLIQPKIRKLSADNPLPPNVEDYYLKNTLECIPHLQEPGLVSLLKCPTCTTVFTKKQWNDKLQNFLFY